MEFQVNTVLSQGNALSPLLFIMVMELISRKIRTFSRCSHEEWKEMFKRHGLRMNLEKTEMMLVGKQREELNVRLCTLAEWIGVRR